MFVDNSCLVGTRNYVVSYSIGYKSTVLKPGESSLIDQLASVDNASSRQVDSTGKIAFLPFGENVNLDQVDGEVLNEVRNARAMCDGYKADTVHVDALRKFITERRCRAKRGMKGG